jgi:hypothetical protein
MIKKYVLAGFVVLFSLLINELYAQAPDTLWTKSIGGSGSESAFNIFEMEDGGFVIGGYHTYEDGNLYIVRTDEEGNVLWDRSHGEDDRYEGFGDMKQTTDGGFILVGTRGEDLPYSSYGDIYLVKTDIDGNFIWQSVLGIPEVSESASSVVETSDGGYLICGYYWASSQTVYDVILIKTNAIGTQEWRKEYSFQSGMADYSSSITSTADGGFVFCGQSQAFTGNYYYDAYLYKIDLLGDSIWYQRYGNPGMSDEAANHVLRATDDGFLISGSQENDGASKDWFIAKTDDAGFQQWYYVFGDYYHEVALSADECNDQGFVVAGSLYDGTWNANLIRFNYEGDTLWTKKWGTESHSQRAYAVKQLTDGGYIVVGTTETLSDNMNIYLTRLEPELVSGMHANEDRNIEINLTNFPNPALHSTTISYNLGIDSFVELKIFDMLGQEIIELFKGFQVAGESTVNFETSKLEPGIYFCSIWANKQSRIIKIVVLEKTDI